MRDAIEALLTFCLYIAILPIFLLLVSFVLTFIVLYWCIGKEVQVTKGSRVYHYKWFKLTKITKK